MTTNRSPSIVWFRQDLRLADQAAFAAACAEGPVLAAYVLDDETPRDWRIGGAQRWWLHHSLQSLAASLKALGVPLVLRRGRAVEEVAKLAREMHATRVHCLSHYEPWWRDAEEQLSRVLDLQRHDGHLLADPDKIRTGAGTSFRVFAPFWKTLQALMPPLGPATVPKNVSGMIDPPRGDPLTSWRLLPDAPDWSADFGVWRPGEDGAKATLRTFAGRVSTYAQDRNLPAIEGSSRLSPHLHMGELSPAAVWNALADRTDSFPFLRELAWRDFASGLVVQLPRYAEKDGRPKMETMAWRVGATADADFKAWTKGRTGYPIVDAGMRQLWHCGWMHNRVRMLTASFLVKHLLIDWRRGERWFWDCLVDADYGNNSVNWQWVAGTGVDSAPFNRIMAPLSQSEKFDAAGYIRRWVPELERLRDCDIHDPHGMGVAPRAYPAPLVGHREGRERALEAIRRAGAS